MRSFIGSFALPDTQVVPIGSTTSEQMVRWELN